MAINILGGHAKGHALFVPPTSITRATTVMLRRKFFDAHQDLTNCLFIDLFAGSGAMGLEACSRGAERVILVEDNPKAINVIKKNKVSMNKKVDTSSVEVVKQKAQVYIKNIITSIKTDLYNEVHLFIDPPYEMKAVYLEILKVLSESGFQGNIWIESDRQKGIVEEDVKKHSFTFAKVYKQGTSYIARIAM